jgi:hypothetical protein
VFPGTQHSLGGHGDSLLAIPDDSSGMRCEPQGAAQKPFDRLCFAALAAVPEFEAEPLLVVQRPGAAVATFQRSVRDRLDAALRRPIGAPHETLLFLPCPAGTGGHQRCLARWLQLRGGQPEPSSTVGG